uniref:Uncharacterized protein n=1 Tax=Rhizophora mucronata TaxID=61149 RepID=A0A2P2QYZ4_RHIMU
MYRQAQLYFTGGPYFIGFIMIFWHKHYPEAIAILAARFRYQFLLLVT